MTKKEFLKIKVLKEDHNLSWAELVKYANKLIEKGR